MKSRFFFVFDFGKLLRLAILILLILVATCSCTGPPGQLPLCRKCIPGVPSVKAVRSAGGGLDTRAAGSIFNAYEGQAAGLTMSGAPVTASCEGPGIPWPHLHGRFVTSPVVVCRLFMVF